MFKNQNKTSQKKIPKLFLVALLGQLKPCVQRIKDRVKIVYLVFCGPIPAWWLLKYSFVGPKWLN